MGDGKLDGVAQEKLAEETGQADTAYHSDQKRAGLSRTSQEAFIKSRLSLYLQNNDPDAS